MTDISRDDLLALTPQRYLAGGYRRADGGIRRELRGIFATAAATQLQEAGLRCMMGLQPIERPMRSRRRLKR